MPRVSEDGGTVFPDQVIAPPGPAAPIVPPAPAPQPPPPAPGEPPRPTIGPGTGNYDPNTLGITGRLWYNQLLRQGESLEDAYTDAKQLEDDGVPYPSGVVPGAPPQVPPVVPVNPAPPSRTLEAAALGRFAGIGVFTSTHPRVALAHVNVLDWVALQVGVASRADADVFNAAGLRVFVWEDTPGQGQRAVDLYNADGYIGQAEGPGQLQAARALADGLNVPKALVTNLFMSEFPSDWVCIPEAYANDNPNATVPNMIVTARNKGATAIAPVLGVYQPTEPGGRFLRAADYAAGLSTVGVGSFSVFLAETMDDSDWQFLANYQAPAPVPVAPAGEPSVIPQTGAPFYVPGTIVEPVAAPTPGELFGSTITPQTVAAAAKATGPVNAWNELLRVFSRRIPAVSKQLNLAAAKARATGG